MTLQSAPARPHVTRSGAATALGRRRTRNEDAHACGPTWFIVADGMGGHRAGDVASRLAVEAFAGAATGTPTAGDVHELVAAADRAIRTRADGHGTDGMGATLVGAGLVAVDGYPMLAVFHLGDARCYQLADGRLSLLTRDHTHVAELVAAGLLAPGGAASHPLRNVVTRALGADVGDVAADLILLPATDRRLLLCSDGLSGAVAPQSIGRVLAGVDDPRRAAERLVALAAAGAGGDDATAVVLDVAGAGAGPP